ncbi:MAG: phage minor capsid protein [Ruminococcus sp.]|nr:phage minor capsid protein [Ruminococcus sp.]
MLTPQTLQHLPDDITELVNELQIDIIKSISKKLVKADYLTPSAEWQLYKASQLMMSTDEVNALIAKFTEKSKRQIKQLYTDACKKAINEDAKIYRAYGRDCSSALRSVALSNALRAGIKNANGMTRNLTKSMVQTSRETVTRLMDKAYIQVASGAFSYQDAIYNAVSELAREGINYVKYPSGTVAQVDVAVRRAVMTGISQTAGQMQLDLAEEMGCDLVEVTSHMGARPSHALWQGKVYSISGESKKYPSLREATGYGTGEGLKGWNCRHDFYPFFEGISKRASMPIDLDENQEEYELSQQQRAMERSIRKSKRTCAALDSAIQSTDDELLKRKFQNSFERHSAILKAKEKRLNDFCNKFGMQKQNDRVRVVGFNKSVSQKAVHGSKLYSAKQLDKSIIDGTIDNKKYLEMLNKRTIINRNDLKNGLPIKGNKHTIIDLYVDDKVSQRRIYGYDGKALIDIDTHNHNTPKIHPTGAHKHIFNYNKKNPHGKPIGFTEQELVNNSDIIQRGVNYFDEK